MRTSLREVPIIRPSLARPAATAGLYFVPAMTAIVGLTVWWTLLRNALPLPDLLVAVLLASVLTACLVTIITLASTNLGVTVEAQGIVVYERSLARAKAIRRSVSWSELRHPEVAGPFRESISIDTDSAPVWLDRRQARAVLTSPGYLHRDQLPPELVKLVESVPE